MSNKLGWYFLLYVLILAGGKGTRLYPLSRAQNPKQFLNIINNKSFLRSTVDRIKCLVSNENIYVVTNEEYLEKICDELPEIRKSNIFVEPSNKETATCIGLSAAKLLKQDKEATMIVLPSDHYIENEKEFKETILQAVEIANKKRGLITIGVQPTRPETGYGYIEMGERVNGEIPTFKVERFLEKPNVEVAMDLLLKGNFLWNSGMFVWRADVLFTKLITRNSQVGSRFRRCHKSSTPQNFIVTFPLSPSTKTLSRIDESSNLFSFTVAISVAIEKFFINFIKASQLWIVVD